MAEFTPIETQEALEAIVSEAVGKERAKYVGFDDIKAENAKMRGEINDLNAKIKKSETEATKAKAALECGLPMNMASRLQGETPEEIHADAESLAKLIGSQKPIQPMFSQSDGEFTSDAWSDLSAALRGGI